MGVATRFFGTTSAGAGDGLTWADRAALFTGGAWSSVLTGFNFGGTDSLLCLVGPGMHTIGATLQTSSFTVAAPTDANPIIFHACDSSGVVLSPPDPDWRSCEPPDWDASVPVLLSTMNAQISSLTPCLWRLFKVSVSGHTHANGAFNQGEFDWVSIYQSSSNANAVAFAQNANRITNSAIDMSGSIYDAGVVVNGSAAHRNVRIRGVTGSSGNRAGLRAASFTGIPALSDLTVFGHGGHGLSLATTGGSHLCHILGCVVANNGGDGIRLPSTASQTDQHRVFGCIITGNGGYGVNAQGAANVLLCQTRLRSNTSGDTSGTGNYPTNLGGVYTTAGADAHDYADAANGDFRIRPTAAIWGKGYGVADQRPQGRRRMMLV